MKNVFDQMEQNAEYHILMFRLKQQLPYKTKKVRAWPRAREFRERMIREGLNQISGITAFQMAGRFREVFDDEV